MHDDQAGVVLGRDKAHFGVLESGDVVDDIRASLECGLGDGGFAGVNRDVALEVANAFDDGDDAVDFVLRRDGVCAGTRGFAADIDHVHAGLDHRFGLRECSLEGVVLAAVVETVGRDV